MSKPAPEPLKSRGKLPETQVPAPVVEDPSRVQTLDPSKNSAPFSLAGRKVLVVDDERVSLRILSGILRGEDYVLAEADSGERALEVYEQFRPDLVLLD